MTAEGGVIVGWRHGASLEPPAGDAFDARRGVASFLRADAFFFPPTGPRKNATRRTESADFESLSSELGAAILRRVASASAFVFGDADERDPREASSREGGRGSPGSAARRPEGNPRAPKREPPPRGGEKKTRADPPERGGGLAAADSRGPPPRDDSNDSSSPRSLVLAAPLAGGGVALYLVPRGAADDGASGPRVAPRWRSRAISASGPPPSPTKTKTKTDSKTHSRKNGRRSGKKPVITLCPPRATTASAFAGSRVGSDAGSWVPRGPRRVVSGRADGAVVFQALLVPNEGTEGTEGTALSSSPRSATTRRNRFLYASKKNRFAFPGAHAGAVTAVGVDDATGAVVTCGADGACVVWDAGGDAEEEYVAAAACNDVVVEGPPRRSATLRHHRFPVLAALAIRLGGGQRGFVTLDASGCVGVASLSVRGDPGRGDPHRSAGSDRSGSAARTIGARCEMLLPWPWTRPTRAFGEDEDENGGTFALLWDEAFGALHVRFDGAGRDGAFLVASWDVVAGCLDRALEGDAARELFESLARTCARWDQGAPPRWEGREGAADDAMKKNPHPAARRAACEGTWTQPGAPYLVINASKTFADAEEGALQGRDARQRRRAAEALRLAAAAAGGGGG